MHDDSQKWSPREMRTIKKFTRQLNVTIAIARAEKKKEIILFPLGCSSPKLIPRRLRTTKGSFTFELFSARRTDGDISMHLLVLSKGVWVSLIVLLKALKLFTRLSHGLHIKLALWKAPAVNFLRSCEQRCIIHRKQIIGVRDISYRLVKPTATRFYVTRSCLNLFWCPNIRKFDLQDKITSRSFLLWNKPDVLFCRQIFTIPGWAKYGQTPDLTAPPSMLSFVISQILGDTWPAFSRVSLSLAPGDE